MSAIGWPGPIGSSPGGGSGVINGTTGFTDSSGGTSCSGSPSVIDARTAVRSPWFNSTSTRLTRRPRLRTVVDHLQRTGVRRPQEVPGHRDRLDVGIRRRAPSRAAFAHSASIAPPCTLGPIVQSDRPVLVRAHRGTRRRRRGVSAIASVNRRRSRHRDVLPRQRSRCCRANCKRFGRAAPRVRRPLRAPDVVTSRMTWPVKSLAASIWQISAAGWVPRPGHQVLVGGRPAAVAQVQVHQALAHPVRHVDGIGARRRGVRQVQRVVGVVAVERVVGRRERRDGRPGPTPALAHPLDRRLPRAEEPVGAEREHVLHRDHHVAARLEFGDLIARTLGVAALPPERRMHDDRLGAELLGGAHAAIQLRDRVGAPHPLGDQQARRVHATAPASSYLLRQLASIASTSWLTVSAHTISSTPS